MMHLRGSGSSPLKLLRNIRDVMASAGSAQRRLDRLVAIIARGLNSDVCSVYLLRAGDVLELFATEGLNKTAVHRTRLRVGEGLIGDIAAHARPLSLWDAQSHPCYVHKPETGEEAFRAFLGVPLLRYGRVVGVLTLQNKQGREYTEAELEILLTVAMVLAELAGSGELIRQDELHRGSGEALVSEHLTGQRMAPGMAAGVAVLHEPAIAVHQVVAEDTQAERQRLGEAVQHMQASIDRLVATIDLGSDKEQQNIMEAYQMFARDRGWINRIREVIDTGLTAEAAVKRVEEELRSRLAQSSNPYLRERLQDMEDLGNRLLRHLTDGDTVHPSEPLPDRAILVARSMSPAELLDYDRSKLRALVLEEGGNTSHIIIVSKALDIPVVGRVESATVRIRAGDPIIVDGDRGEVHLHPSDSVQQAAETYMEHRAEQLASYRAMRDLPAETQDGVAISLNMNAGLFVDIAQLHELGADGIGLYRTELPYMLAKDFPEVDEQARLYGEVLRAAAGKRVVFRTFDIGGDKPVPYFALPKEENPAMGWRATRIALDRPFILRRQFEALIRAADGGPLTLMLPFIAEVSEFDACRDLFSRELETAVQKGVTAPSAVRFGTMLEVPSLLWQLDSLLPRVDFVSVGSNDLMQFLFAADRENAKLAERYDPLCPAMLSVIARIVEACRTHDTELGFCGEMASRPLEALALLGLGIRNLSMPPAAIGPVKGMVRSVDLTSLSAFMQPLATSPEHSLRTTLQHFARDHTVALG